MEELLLTLDSIFDPRFLEKYAGKTILKDPKVAVIELLANAWDAGATKIDIRWPNRKTNQYFSITDNGHGLTDAEFKKRWLAFAYDRLSHQGEYAEFPQGTQPERRRVFGRNGKGRFAGFCFGLDYYVSTSKNGQCLTYKVSQGFDKHPIICELLSTSKSDWTGTTVFSKQPSNLKITADMIKPEIGMRFLMNPNFQVTVDGEKIVFEDLPVHNTEKFIIELEGLEPVEILVITTNDTDSTTRQHGVAWHVNGRLVGACSWAGIEGSWLDGRRAQAKKYTFIVRANCLSESIKSDWSGFLQDDEAFQVVYPAVKEKIEAFLHGTMQESRQQTLDEATKANSGSLKKMGPIKASVWKGFVSAVQESCPSIKSTEIVEISTILANMEAATSKYALIHRLGELKSDEFDKLDQILTDWNVDTAKIVLDVLQERLALIDILKDKVFDNRTDEVHELQPLFFQGLWIFGPEFETIEFTSNRGMTRVISELLQAPVRGSRNRPDFAILPDSTVGLYSYDAYDDHGGEMGIKELVILELKKPTITIGHKDKNQCWTYISELYQKGLLQQTVSRVRCFVLGKQIEPIEVQPRYEMDKKVEITPLDYATVLRRAESRTHKLYEKVKGAPFLNKEEISEFEKPGFIDSKGQSNIFLS